MPLRISFDSQLRSLFLLLVVFFSFPKSAYSVQYCCVKSTSFMVYPIDLAFDVFEFVREEIVDHVRSKEMKGAFLSRKRYFENASNEGRNQLTKIQTAFADGFLKGVDASEERGMLIAEMVDDFHARYQGNQYLNFAYEGAAMSLAMFDALDFEDAQRFNEFWNHPLSKPYHWNLAIGFGWAIPQLLESLPKIKEDYPLFAPFLKMKSPSEMLSILNPFYRHVAVDGVGFWYGYWYPQIVVTGSKIDHISTLDWLKKSDYPSFDKGLGRVLWFESGGQPEKIGKIFNNFSPERRKDLWVGLGFALAFAGGKDADSLYRIVNIAQMDVDMLKVGVAIATRFRMIEIFEKYSLSYALEEIRSFSENEKEILESSFTQQTRLANQIITNKKSVDIGILTHSLFLELTEAGSPISTLYEDWIFNLKSLF